MHLDFNLCFLGALLPELLFPRQLLLGCVLVTVTSSDRPPSDMPLLV